MGMFACRLIPIGPVGASNLGGSWSFEGAAHLLEGCGNTHSRKFGWRVLLGCAEENVCSWLLTCICARIRLCDREENCSYFLCNALFHCFVRCIFLVQKEKSKNELILFFLIERISIFYGRGTSV